MKRVGQNWSRPKKKKTVRQSFAQLVMQVIRNRSPARRGAADEKHAKVFSREDIEKFTDTDERNKESKN